MQLHIFLILDSTVLLFKRNEAYLKSSNIYLWYEDIIGGSVSNSFGKDLALVFWVVLFFNWDSQSFGLQSNEHVDLKIDLKGMSVLEVNDL